MDNFPKGTIQLLNTLNSTSYIITGSLALKLQKKLDREICDIDIITNDVKVIEIMRNNGFELSEAFEKTTHFRFHFRDILFVDVFFKYNTPYEIIQKGTRTYKVTPWWYIYENKLTDRHNNKEKSIKDVLHYYELEKLKWKGTYM